MRASSLVLLSTLLATGCSSKDPRGVTPLPAAPLPTSEHDAGAPAPPPTVTAEAIPAPPPAPWAVANQDPDDDYVVGPPSERPDCIEQLAALGVRAKPSRQPVHREGAKTCGAPQVVTYESGPAGLRWSSPPQVTCLVAIGLSRFEAIAKEEAERELGTKIKRIVHLGTYSCRGMVRFNLASEHSYANAIDIQAFELEGGRRVQVDSHWGDKTKPPATPEARFLRTLARRTFDESAFSVVLGPPWDALHKDHMHLDQARYRVDGVTVR